MNPETLIPIELLPLPDDQDEKVFQCCDEEGSPVGEMYSYNEWVKTIGKLYVMDK